MSWFTSLFALPKVVDTGLDLVTSAAKGIDALFFTDEERSQARQKWWSEVFLPLEKVLAPQGAIRSITRRVLAKAFCETYLFLFIVGFIVFKIDREWAAFALELIKILTVPVSGIVLFFFGAYGVGTYLTKKKDQ